ncbi:hypothetical protein HBI56_170310 [Parastagonospora nodorum]|uniref:Uncharacterized protein n=1 Tax=Phaeosphaeria nodorum (strain SN15 / ATCC MYA-4574 / FGSC 10173) TaxID=321614 RepID=A0A7U2FAW1_PHANO|nr:hypothetical protein HBH56_245150 [Parastagonospora nodorum]QRD01913.1 hypothetical protein JI435_417360 [Parastagonospora nodorum SN15]KAH3935508.1 hypothetical protein HBH54_034220 [Parastagonospora nodorum]KAH3938686.1 hypothetical protein HBH53_247250 [Parastagonospora nodorum]KAH3964256.1 hypothetical protein HBH51_160070 [Parastagonospora nodorum]
MCVSSVSGRRGGPSYAFGLMVFDFNDESSTEQPGGRNSTDSITRLRTPRSSIQLRTATFVPTFVSCATKQETSPKYAWCVGTTRTPNSTTGLVLVIAKVHMAKHRCSIRTCKS